MKHLAWLCVLLVALTASAQESSVPLVLEVRAQRVSRSDLESALRKELDKGNPSEAPKGQLELSDAASNVVRLTYRDASGHESTRDLYLPPDDPEALEKITIAAANLVRDQTAALLAELEAGQPPAEPVPAAPVPVAVKPVQPAPKPAAYDPCHTKLVTPFGVDLAPGVGTSSTAYGRQAARHFSLGLAGTYSAGVDGFEAAIGVNIDRLGSCGAQIALANATFGPVHAMQLGLANFARGNLHGAQLGLANITLGAGRGVQIGIANFVRDGVHGAQLGVANIAWGETNLQLGVLNVARKEGRAQLGVANFIAGNTRAQLGVGNIAWGNAGAQLGVVNIARDDTKVQLGVVNVSRRARAPVGLLSIVRDGHTTLDAWVSENGTLLGGITHGGDRVHNILAFGGRVGPSTRNVFALGIGVRMWTAPRFSLDLDCLYEGMPRFSPFSVKTQVDRLKLNANIWLHKRVGIMVGAGYAVMITEDGTKTQAPFGETVYQRGSETNPNHAGVYGFPTFSVGLRVALSDPGKPRE